jgi:DNA-binding response OmpR family regulator
MPTRILVIDDSPTIRKVVASILERHGYETALAADGQSALDTLGMHRHKFDLVLLDFVMPRMNGYQFCRAVRSKQALARLPIILMSARSDKIRDQFVHQTGAIDAISKPFDAQALLAVIENALRRVQSGRPAPRRPWRARRTWSKGRRPRSGSARRARPPRSQPASPTCWPRRSPPCPRTLGDPTRRRWARS